MKHRVTITLANVAASEAQIDRLLDGFVRTHPEVGPVVSTVSEPGALAVTWSLEAASFEEAHRRSTPVILDGLTAAGLRQVAPTRIEIEAVAADELESNG